MQRRESHTIHFQEFENLERDCYALLRRGNSKACMETLDEYLKVHSDEESKTSLNSLWAQYNNNQSAYSQGVISHDDYTRVSNKINHHIQKLIPQLKPQDFQEYQNSSLRRKSGWDERDNLTVYLQFDRSFNQLGELFDSFNEDWKYLIQIGHYMVNESGEETLAGIDLENESLPTGIARGKEVVFSEDLEGQDEPEYGNGIHATLLEQEEQNIQQDTNQADLKISRRDLKDNNALRIKKVYTKKIPITDEFGNEDEETIEESALAFIEKAQTRFQIWISVVGFTDVKYALINELLNWFETHKLLKNRDAEQFAVGIPQAVDFRASESSPTEFLISMKQPV